MAGREQSGLVSAGGGRLDKLLGAHRQELLDYSFEFSLPVQADGVWVRQQDFLFAVRPYIGYDDFARFNGNRGKVACIAVLLDEVLVFPHLFNQVAFASNVVGDCFRRWSPGGRLAIIAALVMSLVEFLRRLAVNDAPRD